MRLFPSLNPPLADWRGRRAWLVGASSGIGRAIAVELHAKGATVHVSARNGAALDHFTAHRPGASSFPLDVRDAGQVQAAADAILAQGPLDLVVYCAGHYRPQTAHDFGLDEMRLHQEVNYLGALNVVHAVMPSLLREGRGHLSLLGSVAGYRGLPRSLGYGPTKAALIHVAESLYLELRQRGIGVSVVNPGFVDTPLTAQNTFPMPGMISAADAARRTLRGWAAGRFEIHYPRRFTLPMKLLSLLPFGAYQALVRRGTGA
jgi:NAD(P)-dependent dehydrogenase (short-subunit alcohol dehydrogenase family)